MAARQLKEIIGLQDHIVEFEEGERLLPVQPQLHAIEGKHAVDGEVRSDIAQQFDIAELTQPIVIVDHYCIGGAITESKEAFENLADRGDVGRNLIIREHLPALVLAGGVAHLGSPAAHDHDGLVPGLLKLAQHHDGDQVADMERRTGRIEADIARHNLLARQRVEPFGIGQLVDVAALIKRAKKIGRIVHGRTVTSAARWGQEGSGHAKAGKIFAWRSHRTASTAGRESSMT